MCNQLIVLMHGTKNVRGYFSKYRCIFIFVLLSTINVCIWEYHTLMGFVAIQRLYKWEHGWESSSNEFFWVESGVSVLCDSAQISLVLFSSVKPLCKTSQVVSEPMVKTGSNECSMVLVSKVFLARVPGKGSR